MRLCSCRACQSWRCGNLEETHGRWTSKESVELLPFSAADECQGLDVSRVNFLTSLSLCEVMLSVS